MSEKLKLQLVAWSDAAGKADPSAPQFGNEDNFFVAEDIETKLGTFTPDAKFLLGKAGTLLAVADGMGGQNAGEVASALAIDVLRQSFAPGNFDVTKVGDADYRRRVLEEVIVRADRSIKTNATTSEERSGMGSTIVMAWIVGDQMTITWCGDSRAYVFNPVCGLRLLSEDHSFVQDLVRKGEITYEETFDHPQGNIVTRSLGDPTSSVRGETRNFTLHNGDIVLLCSDGLSGVLRDRPTIDSSEKIIPGDTIEGLMSSSATASLGEIRKQLWSAAEKAGWYDNVTVIMARVCAGAGPCTDKPLPTAALPKAKPTAKQEEKAQTGLPNKSAPRTSSQGSKVKIIALAFLCVLALAFGIYSFWNSNDDAEREPEASDAVTGAATVDDGSTVHATEVEPEQLVDDSPTNKVKRKRDKITNSTGSAATWQDVAADEVNTSESSSADEGNQGPVSIGGKDGSKRRDEKNDPPKTEPNSSTKNNNINANKSQTSPETPKSN